jgi:hypothetical protein
MAGKVAPDVTETNSANEGKTKGRVATEEAVN